MFYLELKDITLQPKVDLVQVRLSFLNAKDFLFKTFLERGSPNLGFSAPKKPIRHRAIEMVDLYSKDGKQTAKS